MGALLVYVGVLRYFCFFSKYNVLILTMKKSLPNILRFMSCAAVLYMGFLVAGWVIIGPYSLKFRTLGKSSEALFSLLNGDDMFATFFTINDTNTIIKIFGTIYIYIFVSLCRFHFSSLKFFENEGNESGLVIFDRLQKINGIIHGLIVCRGLYVNVFYEREVFLFICSMVEIFWNGSSVTTS
uniref:Polycystin cation channel PKD1/PKD2 domain-containing protein n=1 Tax=Parascaris equorum TaxID=6256 RepID=A0A914RBN9_PAREQ